MEKNFDKWNTKLSQIRLFDAKRLLRPMGRINNDELNEIKIKLGKIV